MKSIDLLSKACEPTPAPEGNAANTSQITDTIIDKIADAVIAKLSSAQQDPIDKAEEPEAETKQEHAQEQTAEPEAAAAESSQEGEET